jgi:hypothetical protein
MYYLYDEESYEIISKQVEQPEVENYVTYWEDIDIVLYRVIVGVISDDKQMLRHTKFVRDTELLSQKFNSIDNAQAEVNVEVDYRLSLLELGLG